MVRSLVIVSLITLTCTVNYCSSATIVDPGNFFDRVNPVRSLMGAQSYDNAKLTAFNLPNSIIQGVSNMALAPWRGNDFSSRGGKLPNMGNLFRGIPVIGSFMSRPSSYSGASGNFGPMASVEYARPPGSGSGSSSGSGSGSGSSSGYSSSQALSSVANANPSSSQYGGRSTGTPMASSSSGSLQNSLNSLSLRPLSGSQSSPVSLPSNPTSSTINPSSSQLPSLSLGPISNSGQTGSSSSRLSIDPSVASALQSFGFNLDSFNTNGASVGTSATSGGSASNRPSGSAQASAGGSTVSASASSGSSGSSPFGLGSFLSSSSTPGLSQASNFLSNLFSFPLNG